MNCATQLISSHSFLQFGLSGSLFTQRLFIGQQRHDGGFTLQQMMSSPGTKDQPRAAGPFLTVPCQASHTLSGLRSESLFATVSHILVTNSLFSSVSLSCLTGTSATQLLLPPDDSNFCWGSIRWPPSERAARLPSHESPDSGAFNKTFFINCAPHS